MLASVSVLESVPVHSRCVSLFMFSVAFLVSCSSGHKQAEVLCSCTLCCLSGFLLLISPGATLMSSVLSCGAEPHILHSSSEC